MLEIFDVMDINRTRVSFDARRVAGFVIFRALTTLPLKIVELIKIWISSFLCVRVSMESVWVTVQPDSHLHLSPLQGHAPWVGPEQTCLFIGDIGQAKSLHSQYDPQTFLPVRRNSEVILNILSTLCHALIVLNLIPGGDWHMHLASQKQYPWPEQSSDVALFWLGGLHPLIFSFDFSALVLHSHEGPQNPGSQSQFPHLNFPFWLHSSSLANPFKLRHI